MNKVRISQGRVMNSWFRYSLTLIVVCAVLVITIQYPDPFGFAIICTLSFLLIIAWTSIYLVEIDLKKKEYSDLTLVLGRRIGKTHSYPDIEDVFIKRFKTTRERQNYGTGSIHTESGVEYQAYVKFTNGVKLELTSDENKERLIENLDPILKKMNTTLRLL